MKKKVLIIEDEEIIREYICYILENNGFEVLQAKNGVEGLDCFSKKDIDLVITDIFMPEMDGGAIMRILHAVGERVRVIAISGAMSYNNLAAEAKKNGADDVIQKPFTEQELLGVINRCMAKTTA
jgi:DNA-binding response OmpR family regulator